MPCLVSAAMRKGQETVLVSRPFRVLLAATGIYLLRPSDAVSLLYRNRRRPANPGSHRRAVPETLKALFVAIAAV